MIASCVYLLCSATSALCAWMLWLKFQKTRARLLFWSMVCFIGFAVSNITLFVDIVMLPKVDLYLLRAIPAILGAFALIWGLIWESA